MIIMLAAPWWWPIVLRYRESFVSEISFKHFHAPEVEFSATFVSMFLINVFGGFQTSKALGPVYLFY
jgi:hypothetical protein